MSGFHPLPLEASQDWLRQAEELIPVCSQVFSKAPYSFVKGEYPVFLERGVGGRVWDVDGNEFVDFILGLGPVTLGYRNEYVDAAIHEQMKSGITFSLPHPLEVKVARKLRDVIPCAEMARFSKTGSEVNSAAIRLARSFTGKSRIIYGSYHGWHDWYAITTPRNRGIPQALRGLVIPFEYNSLDSLEQAFRAGEGDVAAVIMEPVVLEAPQPGFLEGVIKTAHRHGALVIFDEIVTGFRWHLGGAQAYYGVIPDLATFGKGMANGMPIAAVVGRADVMKEAERVFFSTTFGGETLSLAAALATIEFMQRYDVCGHLWAVGGALQQCFAESAAKLGIKASAVGLAPHFKLCFPQGAEEDNRVVKSLFLQEAVRGGLLIHPTGINVCYAHREPELQQARQVVDAALTTVARHLQNGTVEEALVGEPYREVFRRN